MLQIQEDFTPPPLPNTVFLCSPLLRDFCCFCTRGGLNLHVCNTCCYCMTHQPLLCYFYSPLCYYDPNPAALQWQHLCTALDFELIYRCCRIWRWQGKTLFPPLSKSERAQRRGAGTCTSVCSCSKTKGALIQPYHSFLAGAAQHEVLFK